MNPQDSNNMADVPLFDPAPGDFAMPAQSFAQRMQKEDEVIGKVFQDRYKIVGRLGQGGFGSVYRVEDMRLPGKTWALKELVFKDKSQVGEAVRSFEREARMLSLLMHRSLPVIIDYFSDENSTYLLMEEVSGKNLAELVEEEGPVPQAQALRWALEIAQVLDYLHSQNPPVIFRDLKPENVMITDDRHVKLIDFGLARFFDPNKKRDTTAVGSVGYSPPELWEDSSQTDVRSDVYSFGATMYYVLTGKPPSPVYGKHTVVPYRPELSPRFTALVDRCMEVNPKDRCASAAVIIKELSDIITSSKDADPLLCEELRTESFFRTAIETKRSHVAVAAAKSTGQRESVGMAASTPKYAPVVMALLTVLFVIAGVWSYDKTAKNVSFEFDTPYELVNPDKEDARRCIENKDYNKAASLLDLAVTRHPRDAEAHILKENVNVLMTGGDAVHIPAFMSLTGVDAPEAYRLLYGIAMAQSDYNKAGGVNGVKAVIDIYDDGSDMEKAFALSDKIRTDENYQVMIGPFSSQRTLSVAPWYNDGKLPLLAPVVSEPSIWEQGPFIFTASDTNFPRVRSLVTKLIKDGSKKAGVVVDRDSRLSNAVAKFFRECYKEAGGEIVADEYFSNTNFDNAIEALRKSDADTVFFSDHRGTVLALFARALRGAGLEMPLSSQVAPFTKDMIAVGGDSVNGVIVPGYFCPEAPDPKVKEYCKRFRSTFGDLSPSHLDASAYDAMNIIFDAFKNGANTRIAIRDYLASIGAQGEGARPIYDGVTGKFALGRRLDMRDIYLIQIQDGRYVLIDTEKGHINE